MNITFKKPSQFELFPNEVNNNDIAKNPFAIKDLTLTLENIIVFGIILMMGFVLSFSFGIERGKRLAKTSTEATVEITTADSTDDDGIVVKGETIAAPLKPATEQKVLVDEKKIKTTEKIINDVEEEIVYKDFFTIQIASFKLQKNAQKEADLLKGKGYDTFVVSKGTHSIVCVGRFGEKNEAQQFSQKLKHKYNDYMIRRL